MVMTRRLFFGVASMGFLAPTAALPASRRSALLSSQQSRAWQHGLSLFGDLKYPAGFPHFDYVNPSAPKGGTVRQAAFGTYDNFSLVVAGGNTEPAVP
jgi:microcin C transport system substrate-binding protein